MRRIYAAELRDSWPAWLGVSCTFIAVNAALALTILTTSAGLATVPYSSDVLAAQSYWWTTGVSTVFLILLVAIPVIGSATGLVVSSRRGSLARLALAGASPAQVRRSISAQLVAVTLACAAIGDVIALALMSPWMMLQNYSARIEPWYVPIEPTVALVPMLVSNLVCALVAVVAGTRQAHAASNIPPVEALRQAQAPSPTSRLSAWGWLAIVGCLVLVAVSALTVLVQVAVGNRDVVSNVVMASCLQVFIWAALWAVAAKVVVRPLTQAWTRLLPWRDPVWLLARSTVSARADRLSQSVVPVMFAFAVGVGGLAIFDSASASSQAAAARDQLMMPGLDSFILVFGLPLLIAFMGGVGSLIMMGRQRDAELALAGIAGATPQQRLMIPLVEAVILTVTSVLIAVVVIIPCYIFQAWAFTTIGEIWVPVFSIPTAVIAFGLGFLLTAATTVVPTMPALKLPEQRVVARLIAE